MARPSSPTTAARSGSEATPRSPLLDPRTQHDLERPGRAMLAMELQVGLRDVIRVGQVVVDAGPGPPMRARAVLLRPADRRVDRDVRDVDAFRHELPGHA